MHYESFRTGKFRTFLIFLKLLISDEMKMYLKLTLYHELAIA